MDNFTPVLIIIAGASLLLTLFFFGQVGVQWVRRRLSGNWPWTQTSITDSRTSVLSNGRGSNSYKLTVTYSYSVAGITYTGTYSELCASQSSAEGCLRSLKDMPPPARYKRGKPRVSVMDPYRDAGLAYEHPKAGS